MGDLFRHDRVPSRADDYLLAPLSDAEIEKHCLRVGDLLFCRTSVAAEGVGKCSVVRDADSPLVPASNLIRVRLSPEKADPGFFYYFFSSRFGGESIRAMTRGAAVFTITGSDIGVVPVPPVPLDRQRQIRRALFALDDLIENNRRRIEILEEMARLIYREWFVHFRFPGHEGVDLVDSELGPVPEGWDVERLSDAAELLMGQSPKSEFYNAEHEGLPFHQGVTSFGARYPVHEKWCTIEGRIAEKGDVLLSVRAPVGRINVAPDRLVIGRGLAALRSTRNAQVFLFETLREVFREEDSMGGGTIFKAVTKRDLTELKVICPASELVDRFQRDVAPMFQLIETLTFQNRVLAEARDLLLPRLISGELDVSDLDLDPDTVA